MTSAQFALINISKYERDINYLAFNNNNRNSIKKKNLKRNTV